MRIRPKFYVLAARTPGAPVPPAPSASQPPIQRDDDHSHEVSLSSEDHELRRGARFHVSGIARTEHDVCAFSRVDIVLCDTAGAEHWLGALATDQNGKYDGRLAVPFELDLDDYSVIASTPGSVPCRADAD